MDLGRARIVLRERTLLDVFDLATRFLAAHLGAYAKLSSVSLLPVFVFFLLWAGEDRAKKFWLVLLVSTPVIDALFTILASRLVFEDKVRLLPMLRDSAPIVLRIALARVLQSVAAFLLVFMFVLPSIGFLVTSLFLCEVVALERLPIARAFSRCQRVVALSFGDAALASAMLIFVLILGMGLTDAVLRTLVGQLLELPEPPSLFSQGHSVFGLLGYLLTLPLAITARFFVYLNTRTRTEGWDIQTRFVALAGQLGEHP